MNALPLLGVVLSLAALSCHASERAAPFRVDIEPGDRRALELALLQVVEARLQGVGLFLDGPHWLSHSGPLPTVAQLEARPLWIAEAGSTLALPLAFELRAICTAHSGSCPESVRATLAVSLRKDVWVAARRLRKGSRVSCSDLALERRAIGSLPKGPLTGSCEVSPVAVALRDLSAGAAVRAADFGNAPAVIAGMPVEVHAVANGISITTHATALADAKIGDRLDVRLQNPRRTLRTRVIAPGSVRVLGGSS